MEHTKEFLELAEAARERVEEISVTEARERIENGAVLIDVREDNEFAAGHAGGAIHLGRGIIERDIVGTIPAKDTEIILYCGGGYRSALADLLVPTARRFSTIHVTTAPAGPARGPAGQRSVVMGRRCGDTQSF